MDSNYISIIIPTFNEERNIEKLLFTIQKILSHTQIVYEIIIVDDSSSDNTISIVKRLSETDKKIRLIVRDSNPGLSESVVEGFDHAKSEFIIVMDADLSHPPERIPDIWHYLCDGYDIVIGSRYVKGGKIIDWPFKRVLISKGATLLARFLFPKINDPVSGFFGFNSKIIQKAKLKPRGYKILLELLGKTDWNSFFEIPIIFTERSEGISKLRTRTITDYLFQFFDIVQFKFFKIIIK